MTFDFIGRLKLGFVTLLKRRFEPLQRSPDLDVRDDDHERRAREYEYNYWAVGSPWA